MGRHPFSLLRAGLPGPAFSRAGSLGAGPAQCIHSAGHRAVHSRCLVGVGREEGPLARQGLLWRTVLPSDSQTQGAALLLAGFPFWLLRSDAGFSSLQLFPQS